jgi:hypothetical protein
MPQPNWGEIWPDDRGNDGCGHFPDMAMIRKDSTGIFGLSTAFVNGTLGLPRWPRRPRPRCPAVLLSGAPVCLTPALATSGKAARRWRSAAGGEVWIKSRRTTAGEPFGQPA